MLMVVEVDGDGADPPKDQLLDLGGLAVWLGRAEKKAFDETASAFFRRAIVALALGLGGQVLPVFQKIGSVIYLIEADTNRRIFPVTISASGRATLATSISVATATDITTHYLPALSSATNLDSVIQLLGQSHDDDADTLRAFLTVWTALEMLIEKGFRTYKAEFFKILGMAVPMGAAIAWQRIQNLRDGNYPLLDKFAVMAAVLEPEDPADDFREFEKIKNARDPLYHEMKGDVEALPVAATRRLLVEYVRLHLTHAGKARS
jgi:hypothetical protein